MSYLNLPGGIENFSKATISFWFRVPKTSFAAVSADFDFNPGHEEFHAYPPFNGIIPLLVFGDADIEGYYTLSPLVTFNTALREARGFNDVSCTWVSLSTTTEAYTDYQVSEGPHYPLAPCYVGVKVNPFTSTGTLQVNLQFPEPGTMSGLDWYTTSVAANAKIGNVTTRPTPPCNNGPVESDRPDGTIGWIVPGESHTETWTKGDLTAIVAKASPEAFTVNLDQVEITPDHWHHLLLSFDLGGSITATGRFNPGPDDIATLTTQCKLWLALDDVNYTNVTWAPISAGYARFDLGDNGIVSTTAFRVSQTEIGGDYTTGPYVIAAFDIGDYLSTSHFTGGGKPIFSWSPPLISGGEPLGIPAPARYVEAIYPVEMAELQFFTGVTLDTGDESNRRAFITKAGTPADPLRKPNAPPPIPLPPGWVPPPKGPQELLGKQPEILLHGSGNWIAGKNSGKKIKLNEIGQPVPQPADDLHPTGLIAAYSPDPSLHGAQSPPPPKPPAPHSTLRL